MVNEAQALGVRVGLQGSTSACCPFRLGWTPLLPFYMAFSVPAGQAIWSKALFFVQPPSAHGHLGLVGS